MIMYLNVTHGLVDRRLTIAIPRFALCASSGKNDMIIGKTTNTTNLEDVCHVVLERIHGIVGEDEQVFDQIKFLNFVVNDFLLVWI